MTRANMPFTQTPRGEGEKIKTLLITVLRASKTWRQLLIADLLQCRGFYARAERMPLKVTFEMEPVYFGSEKGAGSGSPQEAAHAEADPALQRSCRGTGQVRAAQAGSRT